MERIHCKKILARKDRKSWPGIKKCRAMTFCFLLRQEERNLPILILLRGSGSLFLLVDSDPAIGDNLLDPLERFHDVDFGGIVF